MDIGGKIYYHRKMRGLTQKELAHGICSVPYLSKLENNNIKPNAEILSLLTIKLGITIKEDNPDKKEDLHILLNNWYKSIVRRYKGEAVEKGKLVDNRITEINDPDILIKYKLIKIRYRLLVEDFGTIEVLFQELKEMKKYFSEENDYYYNYFYGQYKYVKDDDLTDSLTLLRNL